MFTFTLTGRKNEFGEYRITCFKDGKRYPDGDYYTESMQDAENTLKFLRDCSDSDK